jgi:hypothetical protein
LLTRRERARSETLRSHSKSVTDYKEFPGRSHYTVGQDGWEEVADYALEWAVQQAAKDPAT